MSSANITGRSAETQTVTEVMHWDEQLFSFRITRPLSLRFRSGEFLMIGLDGQDEKPIMRAYSIASPSWDEELEFYSIKIPNGPLTSQLQKIKSGDAIILRPKPVGTLVVDALLPGKRLFMIASGTGIAPFASLIRDPEVYDKFEQIYLLHTCRKNSEHLYGRQLISALRQDPLIGEFAERLTYYPTTTRELSDKMGRCTDLIRSGAFFEDLAIEKLNPETDRAMVCGSKALNFDVKQILEDAGLTMGTNSKPGEYVVERAFVGEGI